MNGKRLSWVEPQCDANFVTFSPYGHASQVNPPGRVVKKAAPVCPVGHVSRIVILIELEK